MANKKPVYLRCLDVEHNHYKYYKMIPINDTTFRAEYGREGNAPQTKEYPMSKWDSTYRSKLAKGYEDKSEHFVLEATSATPKVDNSRTDKDGTTYAEIADIEVRKLVNKLLELSKKTVAANYKISARHVTQKMIDDAQGWINIMSDAVKQYDVSNVQSVVNTFNKALIELLNTIPRKAATKMSDELIVIGGTVDRLKQRMIDRIRIEEGLLDNMRTCVTAAIIDTRQEEKVDTKDAKPMTLLEALGLEIENCDDADIKRIMGCFKGRDVDVKHRFIKAFRVKNKVTAERFEKFKDNNRDGYKRFPQELLWHGSRNENWWSIINNGLKIRPSNAVYTGSMFGDGLYFATSAQKSFGYTSSSSAYWVRGSSDLAIMALFDVGVGNQLNTDNNYGDFRNMNWHKIRSKKDSQGRPYHSVYAHQGNQLRNDELIMYNSDQVTIKYLVLFRG